MYRIIPAFHWANSMSLLGLFFSITGIYNSILGDLNQAMIFFVLAGISDLFDGKFANRFKRNGQQKQMGEFVDSFVDMISFAAFPVVLLFRIVGFVPVSILVAFLFVVMAIHRLGYFHITKEEQTARTGSFDYFIGVPLTYIALAVPIFYTTFLLFNGTETVVFRLLVQLLYLAMGLAYVWNRPVPKPRGKMYGVFVGLAVLVIIVLGSR